MQEQQKPRSAFDSLASSGNQGQGIKPLTGPSIVEKLEALQGKVKIISGATCDEDFDLAGQTVNSVRASLVDAYNIPPQALAYINGQEVSGSHVLKSGEVLEFIQRAGSKG